MNSLKFVQANENDVKEMDVTPTNFISEISMKARDLSQNKKDLFLVVAIGQEHKLGRWFKQKECKNSVKIIKLSV